MLSEMAELLEKTGKADDIVIGQYSLKSGLYIKFDKEGNIIDRIVVNKNISHNSELYNWFKVRDYYSKLIEMNKVVDKNKKIHSNNIYTMFIKCISLPQVGDKGKALDYNQLNSVIDDYYNKLNSEGDKKEKNLLEFTDVEAIDTDVSGACKDIFKNCINNLISIIEELDSKEGFSPKTDYVKLFIESDEDDKIDLQNYIREYKRYFIPKVYNNNNTNIVSINEIYGLSNENMGLNQKKPYLELKTTKFKVPYRVPVNQAKTNRMVMEWIENAKDDTGKSINTFNIDYDYDFEHKPELLYSDMGICFETMPTKSGIVITDSDILPRKIENLDKYFDYINYLNIENNYVTSTRKRYVLEKYIDKVYFKNQMKILYFNAEYKPKGLSSYYINSMVIMKQPMKNFFRLGIKNSLNYLIDKMTLGMVTDSLVSADSSRYDLIMKMNMRLNLLKYFEIGGKENMGDILSDVIDKVKSKISQKEYTPVESNDEYYYCIGQLVYYLCSLSEAKNKTQNMYNDVLCAKNQDKLKSALFNLFIKYNYNINSANFRFNSMYTSVMGYNPSGKINTDMIICGLLSDNLIYAKEGGKES